MLKPVQELAAHVRGRDIAAREVVSAALARIEDLDGRVNAFVEVDAERALAAADEVEAGDARPFAGVPIAIKDHRVRRRPPASHGFALGDFRPRPTQRRSVDACARPASSSSARRTRPSSGSCPSPSRDAFGPSRNPWDTGRTPGGSSGGSAAAVASGMTAIGYGGDGGGSIRIPAACCGLFGIKPSRGRISAAPVRRVAVLRDRGHGEPHGRRAAAALDVMAGYEPGDPHWAAEPKTSFADAATREPGRLRVAHHVHTAPPRRDPEHCVAGARDRGVARVPRPRGHGGHASGPPTATSRTS